MSNGDGFSNKAEAFEAFDDCPTHNKLERSIGNVIARRFCRRDILKGALAVPVSTALFGSSAATTPAGADGVSATAASFAELAAGVDDKAHVADGYSADVLLSWGDPLCPGLEPFDPLKLSAAEQEKRFGYNNDHIAFFQLDAAGDRALLCINHEYASPEVMFPGVGRPDKNEFKGMDRPKVDVEMAAHGVTVVEIARRSDGWKIVLDSPKNRRITANTAMTADGSAAGHERLKTRDDPTGLQILGTLNNCGGGVTPWGTYLTCEENFNGYFWTDEYDDRGKRRTKGLGGAQQSSYDRYGIPSNWYNWGAHHARFNVDREPNEANRFGWIVEIDPFDPASIPVKKTALGRFRHECADVTVNADGRVVVYSGDDSPFEYVYRFVSKDRMMAGDRAHNAMLLSEGTLSAARFEADGTLTWLPLVFGEGPLTAANGFAGQAGVMIDARLAASLLGATPMDRPEDVQTNPKTGKVYVSLTNNEKRGLDDTDAANPRSENFFGHIIELTPPGGDHTAATFTWDILVKCGDPRVAGVGALWNPATSESGWFACPDNVAFDADGRLWVTTDQGKDWGRTGRADGFYAVETEGAVRGASKMFFRVPVGAECTGPCFDPKSESLFLSVQHPGTDGVKDWPLFGRDATFDDPPTRWPDFKPGMPPRPSVVVVRKMGGGKIA